MNRKIFCWILCFLILGENLGWCRETTTIRSRVPGANGGIYQNGNDIYVDYDTNYTGVLGGGCMWLYTQPADIGPSFWDNNVFLKGYGLINGVGGLENTGALRFGEGAQTYTTPVVLSGDVTLLADAAIGIEVASNCNLHAYITGELKTAGESEGETFTLRQDASNVSRSGTLVIINDNPSFSANWDIRKGVLQIGAVGINFHATGYEWTGEPESLTQNTSKPFSFDGTTGGLGTGDVVIDSPATLKFARSNHYEISNAISGSGKIIFSGGGHGTLTGSIASTIASIEVEAGSTFQTNEGAISNPITGDGFYQIHYSGSNVQKNPTASSHLTNFSGVLLMSGDNRWGLGVTPSDSYAIGAIDDAQIWVTGSTDIRKDIYLSGIGWNSNERFGALRLAGSVTENSAGGVNMSHIMGNVVLLGDTRVSARSGNYSTSGMISGNITGDHTLSTGGNVAGTLILTGENSYGNTHITGTTTLQIGYSGKINGNKTFDGTQGTLGTGSVTIDPGATLKFVRTDTLTLENSVAGSGNIVFDGGGNYSWTGNVTGFTGSWNVTNGTWMIEENQHFSQSIVVGNDGELAGLGTVENVTMNGGKVHSTLNFTQDEFELDGIWVATLGNESEPVTFDIVQIADGSGLEISLMEDYQPETDIFYLLTGNDESFAGLNLENLLVNSILPSNMWTLGIDSYGNGLGLYVQIANSNVPEPSSWLLILMGGAGLLGWRICRKRHYVSL